MNCMLPARAVDLRSLLMLAGDVEANPGPMSLCKPALHACDRLCTAASSSLVPTASFIRAEPVENPVALAATVTPAYPAVIDDIMNTYDLSLQNDDTQPEVVVFAATSATSSRQLTPHSFQQRTPARSTSDAPTASHARPHDASVVHLPVLVQSAMLKKLTEAKCDATRLMAKLKECVGELALVLGGSAADEERASHVLAAAVTSVLEGTQCSVINTCGEAAVFVEPTMLVPEQLAHMHTHIPAVTFVVNKTAASGVSVLSMDGTQAYPLARTMLDCGSMVFIMLDR